MAFLVIWPGIYGSYEGCLIKVFFVSKKFIKNHLSRKRMQPNFKQLVRKGLTKKEQEHLKTAFDIIGDIAILEIDDALRKKEKFIAQTLLKCQKNVKTVLRKDSAHEGELRLQKLKWLAGKKTKETIHVESNSRLKLNVEKVYFSPRMGHERLRIARQVRPSENILVMFSGCAPYPVVLARNTKAAKIVGIELNPIGHEYGLENVRLNKLDNVNLYQGDVRDVKLKEKFDRILMPLPRSAEDYLDIALKYAKKGTIIHFYDFLHIDDFEQAKQKVRKACKNVKRKCEILDLVKCGQYSPRTYRICVDFKIS